MNAGILAEILDKVQITLVRYGHGKHPAGTLITTYFPDFDFWYILSGSILLDINGKKYEAAPPDAFLMTPGTTITLAAMDYSELLFCHFIVESGSNMYFQGDFTDYKVPSVHEDLFKIFTRYFFDLSSSHVPSKIAVKSVLKTLLAEMLLSNKDNLNAFLSRDIYSNLKPLSSIFKYIQENIGASISNKKLASLLGFNENYFSRYFKKHTGISPKQYIIKAKMDHARHLLTEGGLSVKETAFETGFSDQFIFSKKFKKFYGISPSSFKDLNT